MALSNAQAAKRALYDGLREALDSDIGVWHSAPNVDHPPNDNVIVGPFDRPLTFNQEWRSMGAGARRTEDLDIPLLIEVVRGGTDQFAVEERAWAIAEEVATWLATRPLEAIGYFEAHPDRGELAAGPSQDGRIARLTLSVSAKGTVGGI